MSDRTLEVLREIRKRVNAGGGTEARQAAVEEFERYLAGVAHVVTMASKGRVA